jgi:ribosomal protein S27AE
MFKDRKLIIATKHEKEKVIAPILEKELGVFCFVDKNFDTDILGTFTGEVERKLDPISTLRQKCLLAMELNNCDLGVASEGSFGPHPTIFFVNADDELIIFIDKKNDLEIIVRELSTSTNFNGKEIRSEVELTEFVHLVNFPSHGVILRKTEGENEGIVKDMADFVQLKEAFRQLFSSFQSVYAETDMRAMNNPTRMQVIAIATEKLIEKINSLCPNCNLPGFGITDMKKRLKCSLCGSPTNSTLSHIYTCQHCDHKKEKMYPNLITAQDPMYCNYCNP